jgi:hypothetical protein
MIRSKMRALVVLCLAGVAGLTVSARDGAGILKELNVLLASACFNKPVLTLAADGTVVRTDRNGTTHTFKLRDIGDIVNDRPDAQANIVLRCRDDSARIAYAPGGGRPKTTGKLTVFTITPNAPTGEQVLKLFKDLRAASAAGK